MIENIVSTVNTGNVLEVGKRGIESGGRVDAGDEDQHQRGNERKKRDKKNNNGLREKNQH